MLIVCAVILIVIPAIDFACLAEIVGFKAINVGTVVTGFVGMVGTIFDGAGVV
jgi:hypothetical protein